MGGWVRDFVGQGAKWVGGCVGRFRSLTFLSHGGGLCGQATTGSCVDLGDTYSKLHCLLRANSSNLKRAGECWIWWESFEHFLCRSCC